MADTGWLETTNGVTWSVSGRGTQPPWFTPSRVAIEDNIASYTDPTLISGGQYSRRLDRFGFGAAVPSEATVTGVEFELRVKTDVASFGATIVDVYLRQGLTLGNISPNNLAGTSALLLGAAYQNVIYGGPDNLWGYTGLTPAEVNDANFGVLIAFQNNNAKDNIRIDVDYMSIKVYYSLGGSTSKGLKLKLGLGL